MSERLLTTAETIKILNISRQTLYDWMKQGIIKPVDMYPAQFRRRPQLMFREHEVRALAPAEPLTDEEVPRRRGKNRVAA